MFTQNPPKIKKKYCCRRERNRWKTIGRFHCQVLLIREPSQSQLTTLVQAEKSSRKSSKNPCNRCWKCNTVADENLSPMVFLGPQNANKKMCGAVPLKIFGDGSLIIMPSRSEIRLNRNFLANSRSTTYVIIYFCLQKVFNCFIDIS